MKIRDRLSLQFTLIFAVLLLLVLAAIYLLTAKYRAADFYTRLEDRAFITGQLFLAEDNLSEEKFRAVQQKYPQSLPGEFVRIYNDQNQAVFLKDPTQTWPPSVIEKVRSQGTFHYSQGAVRTAGIYYKDNSGNFVVLASAIDVYGDASMRQLFWSMFSVLIISIVIMYFLGSLFARIALFPITKVINEVKIIRSSSLNKRLAIKEGGKDEIDELAITFNNLLEHLEQSFDAQRSFVANASHELRTPLTSIVGNIEVTLGVEREKEEYKEVLTEVLVETEKLTDLVNDLFDLSHSNIDVNDFHDLRLDELLWQVKDEWSHLIPGSRIELHYHHLPDDPRRYTIPGNSHLLFVALGNILKNAVKFSDMKPVTCTMTVQDDKVIIAIEDRGIGIKPEDVPHIFEPFYRGTNAQNIDGLGIGLSLTDKILRLHGATVHVRSEWNEGTTFFIIFPV
ncbi:sensor histidine kinase [Dinghuibacter silviterrae]|uniref:histidine kinase n=1 Tax=Dinghuibacter silviterrae TaxID=1539049 RepID=A0A4R8DPW9_9BACT|nr:HAMP domain-containing sensor histidine kinase [Dinghuibacter silviterrae]TDW99454.1 signal transduction histidine kinase [Dinghuibacter silviterrae]